MAVVNRPDIRRKAELLYFFPFGKVYVGFIDFLLKAFKDHWILYDLRRTSQGYFMAFGPLEEKFEVRLDECRRHFFSFAHHHDLFDEPGLFEAVFQQLWGHILPA